MNEWDERFLLLLRFILSTVQVLLRQTSFSVHMINDAVCALLRGVATRQRMENLATESKNSVGQKLLKLWEKLYVHSNRRFTREKRLAAVARLAEIKNYLTPLGYVRTFRMPPSAIEELARRIGNVLTPKERAGWKRRGISLSHALHLLLWRLGQSHCYTGMGITFNLCATTVCKLVNYLVDLISERMTHYIPDVLEGPLSPMTVWGHALPGAILAIDGTHIPFLPPAESRIRDQLYNRKSFTSLNVLLVVTNDFRVAYFDAGSAGTSSAIYTAWHKAG